MKQPIFILGVTTRSGTNFLYNLLKLHPDCFVAEPIWEDFLLKHSDKLRDYANGVSKEWDTEWGLDEKDKEELLQVLGEGLQTFLSRRGPDDKRLLTKTPDVTNLSLFFRFFPNAKLLIIIRDGRAVVESTINSFTRNTFERAARKWDRGANIIAAFKHNNIEHQDAFRIIRYEDLYQSTKATLLNLFDFLDLDTKHYPFNDALDLPVSGSSYFRGNTEELNWEPVEKTEAFKPLERFKHWTPDQHNQFNEIGLEMLRFFGYKAVNIDENEIQTQWELAANSRNAPCPCGSNKRFKECHGMIVQQGIHSNKDSDANKNLNKCSALDNNHLYCKEDFESFRFDQSSILVLIKKTGSKIIVTETAFAILNQLNVFKTAEEHFASNTERKRVPKADFFELMNEFLQKELIRSSYNFIAMVHQNNQTSNAPTPFGGIVIRTCERPDHLERLLQSLEKRSESNNEVIFILDDSRSINAQQKNQSIIQGANANDKSANQIKYLGQQWQLSFINNLCAAFAEQKEIINWLLAPKPSGQFSGGRLIDIALLILAGKRFITYDDDYLLHSSKENLESVQPIIQFSNKTDWQFVGYPSMKAVVDDGLINTFDPIKMHTTALGMTLSHLLAQNNSGKEISVDGLNSKMIARCQPDSPIITTGNGVFGCPINPNGNVIYTQPYKNILPPWKDNRSYSALVKGNYVWRNAIQHTLLPNTVSTPVGIDNSFLIPPTIPVGKGEDSLFTILIQNIHPHSLHLEFPWAIGHFRETKDWGKVTFSEPNKLNLAQLMWTISTRIGKQLSDDDMSNKFDTLGSGFIQWSQQSDTNIKQDLSSILIQITSNRIKSLRRALRSEDISSCENDINRIIKVNEKQLFSFDTMPTLEDSSCPDDETGLIEWVREQFYNFGMVLKFWPSLWAYCATNSDYIYKDILNPHDTPDVIDSTKTSIVSDIFDSCYEQRKSLPDFLIIGAQKAGTTALLKNLEKHPDIRIANEEIHFFEKDTNWSLGIDWYTSHFLSPNKIQGEKTPDYLPSFPALQRMATTLPDAKIILMLRNPVDRAYSAWNHFNQNIEKSKNWGWEIQSFEDVIQQAREDENSPFFRILDFGTYYPQIQNLLQCYPRSQIFIGIAEKFRSEPNEQLNILMKFLGVKQTAIVAEEKHVRQYNEEMNNETRQLLENYFEGPNRELFDFLGEEIKEWKSSSVSD